MWSRTVGIFILLIGVGLVVFSARFAKACKDCEGGLLRPWRTRDPNATMYQFWAVFVGTLCAMIGAAAALGYTQFH